MRYAGDNVAQIINGFKLRKLSLEVVFGLKKAKTNKQKAIRFLRLRKQCSIFSFFLLHNKTRFLFY